MMAAMEYIEDKMSVNQIKLDAQISAQKFYESLGFIAHGEVFLDAGIDHISMVRFIKR